MGTPSGLSWKSIKVPMVPTPLLYDSKSLLADQLEEESSHDTDYYISAPTIDMLEESGADASLVKLLRDALGGRDGFELRWTRG